MPEKMFSRRPLWLFLGLTTLLAGCGSEEIVGTDGIDAAVAPPGVHLAFTVQPSTTSANATISPALKVTVLDGQGNVYTGFSGKINVALENNPTAATLMGTKSQTVLSGVATFPNLSIKKSGGAYTLSAKATISGTALAVTSDPFDITPGSLWIIKFDTVPVPTVAGQTISPVRVVAIDSFFNRVTSFNETVGIGINTANPPGGALLGTASATAVSGVATFSDLSIQKVATYSLRASWGTLITNSNNFKITPAAATHLLFTVPPKTTAAGAKFNPALKVTAYDQFENKATDFAGNVTMAIGNNPSGGTLSGTLTWAAVAGVATFSGTLGLSIDKAGAGYTLVASSNGLTSVTSGPFDITAGAASVLAFTVQPSNTAPGAVITPAVQVTMRDAQGNTVAFNNNITLSIGTNPAGGTLSGTKTQKATNGTATFPGLSINNAGTGYTLQASGGNKSGTSAPFDIGAGAGATQLAFTVQPSTAQAGSTIAPPVKVTAQNAQGATVTGFTGNITVALGTNPGGATLSGTSTVGAVGGVATFSNLSINNAGSGYTLQASSGSIAPATSTAFNVTGQGGTLTDLGGPNAEARGINEAGQVVGYNSEPDPVLGCCFTHAVMWQNGSMTDLGSLGGHSALAQDINNFGQVTGQSSISGDNETHAFIWQNGTMTDLGTAGQTSSANAVNDNGQVVGQNFACYSCNPHAALWQNGTMVDLGTFGGTYSVAYGINNNGQVVGDAYNSGNAEDHAFIWQNGTMTDLGTLGGVYSQALGINASGQVVGQSSIDEDGHTHAFLWQNGVMTDLGVLGGNQSRALAINDNGDVVGFSTTDIITPDGDTETHAFLWRNGTMMDLGTLQGGTFSNAEAISNNGRIAGSSSTSSGEGHATVWSGF